MDVNSQPMRIFTNHATFTPALRHVLTTVALQLYSYQQFTKATPQVHVFHLKVVSPHKIAEYLHRAGLIGGR